MSQDTAIKSESIVNSGKFSSDGGNITSDGVLGNLTVGGTFANTGLQTAASQTVTGAFLLTAGKVGKTVAGDIFDFSSGAALLKPGTTLQISTIVASGANISDKNGNEIAAVSKGTVSASTTVTGNYVGGTTGAGTNATITYVGWMQTSGAAAAETITIAGSAPSNTITLSASSTGTCMVAAL